MAGWKEKIIRGKRIVFLTKVLLHNLKTCWALCNCPSVKCFHLGLCIEMILFVVLLSSSAFFALLLEKSHELDMRRQVWALMAFVLVVLLYSGVNKYSCNVVKGAFSFFQPVIHFFVFFLQ